MKNLLTAALFVATVFASAVSMSATSMAAEKTIKLSVPGMTCASCPFIVEGAIDKLDGISSVKATVEDLSATVTFDDSLTNLDEITQATTDAGYPSSLLVAGSGS